MTRWRAPGPGQHLWPHVLRPPVSHLGSGSPDTPSLPWGGDGGCCSQPGSRGQEAAVTTKLLHQRGRGRGGRAGSCDPRLVKHAHTAHACSSTVFGRRGRRGVATETEVCDTPSSASEFSPHRLVLPVLGLAGKGITQAVPSGLCLPWLVPGSTSLSPGPCWVPSRQPPGLLIKANPGPRMPPGPSGHTSGLGAITRRAISCWWGEP